MNLTGTSDAIEARALTKQFGSTPALDRVDLDLTRGETVALFGPNGAGKTTLVRILTLGLRATSGRLRIFGLTPGRDSAAIRNRIGLISHRTMLYDSLTASENLEFFARLYGVRNPRKRSTELLEAIGLPHRAADPVGTLSRGMQQRVSIARALVHDPDLVFLDEPFAGLDPRAAATLHESLRSLRDRGRTVLLVTHDLRRGLELCDRWLLLIRGKFADAGRAEGTDAAALEQAFARGPERPVHRVAR